MTDYVSLIDAWAVSKTEGRDASHAIEHFRRVKNISLLIMDKSKTEMESVNLDSKKIVVSAALLHDVFDHKYATKEEAEAGMETMKKFLREVKINDSNIDWGPFFR